MKAYSPHLLLSNRNLPMEEIQKRVKNLPDDPNELASMAFSSSKNFQKLSCCLKLIELLRLKIPNEFLSSEASTYLNEENLRFESVFREFFRKPYFFPQTKSHYLSSLPITNILSCCFTAIGPVPFARYKNYPWSIDYFDQCARTVIRLLWYCYVRYHYLKSLKKNNMSILKHAFHLYSFLDIAPNSQKTALFLSNKFSKQVDLKYFAHFIVPRFLTDSTRELYDNFIQSLPQRQQMLYSEMQKSIEKNYDESILPKMLCFSS
jgi:hypothetical protein